MAVVANDKTWDFGGTLDLSLKPKPSPFTAESITQFINSFKQKVAIYHGTFIESKDDEIINTPKDKEHDQVNDGQFSLTFNLCKDNQEVREALGVKGNLSVTYGPISGDADLKFAMDNSNGSFDSSLIVRGIHKGRTIKNEIQEHSKLKLKNNILERIKPNDSGKITYTFDDFKNEYGAYLIVGYEYGGEIVWTTTYKTSSLHDKLSFEGNLSVSYAGLLSGSVGGNYEKKKLNGNVSIVTDYRVKPSYSSALLSDPKTGIIKCLNDLSRRDDKQDIMTLKTQLESKMIKFLGGKRLDVLNAIVMHIKNIDCVKDSFVDAQISSQKVASFCKWSGKLMMGLNEIEKGLKTVYSQCSNIHIMPDQFKNFPKIISGWDKRIERTQLKMEFVTMDDILNDKDNKKSILELWKTARDFDDSFSDFEDCKEIEDSVNYKPKEIIKRNFWEMDERAIRNEFNEMILKPFTKLQQQIRKKKEDEQKEQQGNNYDKEEKEDVMKDELYIWCKENCLSKYFSKLRNELDIRGVEELINLDTNEISNHLQLQWGTKFRFDKAVEAEKTKHIDYKTQYLNGLVLEEINHKNYDPGYVLEHHQRDKKSTTASTNNDIYNNPEKPKLDDKGKTVPTKYGYLRPIWGAYSKKKSISDISFMAQNRKKMQKFKEKSIWVGTYRQSGWSSLKTEKYIWLDRNGRNAITELCLWRGAPSFCEALVFDGFIALEVDNPKLYLCWKMKSM
eukprot:213745_1